MLLLLLLAPSTLGSSLSELQIQRPYFSPLSHFRPSSFLRVGSATLNRLCQIEACECSTVVIGLATTNFSHLPLYHVGQRVWSVTFCARHLWKLKPTSENSKTRPLYYRKTSGSYDTARYTKSSYLDRFQRGTRKVASWTSISTFFISSRRIYNSQQTLSDRSL